MRTGVAVIAALAALGMAACDKQPAPAGPVAKRSRAMYEGAPVCGAMTRAQLDETVVPRLRKAVPTEGIFFAAGGSGGDGLIETRTVIDLGRGAITFRPMQNADQANESTRPLAPEDSAKLTRLVLAARGAPCPPAMTTPETAYTLVVAHGDDVFVWQGAGSRLQDDSAARNLTYAMELLSAQM